MSQKVNPIIFRLGLLNQWSSKFIQNKNQDFSFFLFNYLELKKLIFLFLKKYNLNLIDFKLYSNKQMTSIFISYFNSNFGKSTNFKIKFNKFKLKNNKNFLKNFKLVFLKKYKIKKIFNYLTQYTIYFEKLFFRNIINKQFVLTIKKRLYLLKYLTLLNSFQNFTKFKNTNYFNKQITKICNYFLKNNMKRFNLVFKQLNSNNFSKIEKLKKQELNLTFLNFRQFEKKKFFKSGINLFYILSKSFFKKKLSLAVSKFMSSELSKVVNINEFNLFLKFIINCFKHFFLNKINGFEIVIKGNLGKNSRSYFKTFKLGNDLSKTKLNKVIDYNKTTSFSKKGVLGISVSIF